MYVYLQEIIKYKREEIKSLKLADRSRNRPPLDPVAYLRNKPFIAEIKKASPSLGDINTDADVVYRARSYEQGGAGAISVLTDSRFFRGDFCHLADISQAVSLPLLCKDFILSEVQIENAYLHGADVILLIAAILTAGELKLLAGKAAACGISVLYEIHRADEFEKIKALDPGLVGVNSRDLTTFKIDTNGALRTISSLKGDFLKTAESGIESARDVLKYRKAGADAFLVGTALMQASDPVAKLKEFRGALEGQCS